MMGQPMAVLLRRNWFDSLSRRVENVGKAGNGFRHMRQFACLLILIAAAGCQSTSLEPAAERSLIQAAVDNPARPAADRTLDPMRQPVEVLTFFRIRPGMHVLDLFAGGGYYTEIISYLVGPAGSVTLYNNNPWNNFVNRQVEQRLDNNRLPNVRSLVASPAELAGIDERYDAAILILAMHDLYYEDSDNGWPRIDHRIFLDDIYGLLEPGGILGIIDHNALSGSDPEVVGKSLHRIDPGRVIDDLQAAGFIFEESSDVLRNPDDDLTGLVFTPELRWRSDRSVMRFRKP